MKVDNPQIWLDCDGVVASFDDYFHGCFGYPPRVFEDKFGTGEFWSRIKDHGFFFLDIPLMHDALDLYNGVKHLNPKFLTGVPNGGWAEDHKLQWRDKHFPGVEMITCRSADKVLHMKPGDVLIDDWQKYRAKWIAAGGIFISHYDAKSSLAALWAHYPELENKT